MKLKEDNLKLLLDKIQMNVDKLYHVATHDQKTGSYNHVFFKEVIGFELEKAKRGKPLSVVGVDIDFFRKINDAHGHFAADRVLERLARVLERAVREYDIVARFGGEEFFIMLPNTTLARAKKVGERIRKAILRDKMLSKYKVTVSVGVSEYKNKDNFDRICKRADRAMYKAKKEGIGFVFNFLRTF